MRITPANYARCFRAPDSDADLEADADGPGAGRLGQLRPGISQDWLNVKT